MSSFAQFHSKGEVVHPKRKLLPKELSPKKSPERLPSLCLVELTRNYNYSSIVDSEYQHSKK